MRRQASSLKVNQWLILGRLLRLLRRLLLLLVLVWRLPIRHVLLLRRRLLRLLLLLRWLHAWRLRVAWHVRRLAVAWGPAGRLAVALVVA